MRAHERVTLASNVGAGVQPAAMIEGGRYAFIVEGTLAGTTTLSLLDPLGNAVPVAGLTIGTTSPNMQAVDLPPGQVLLTLGTASSAVSAWLVRIPTSE